LNNNHNINNTHGGGDNPAEPQTTSEITPGGATSHPPHYHNDHDHQYHHDPNGSKPSPLELMMPGMLSASNECKSRTPRSRSQKNKCNSKGSDDDGSPFGGVGEGGGVSSQREGYNDSFDNDSDGGSGSGSQSGRFEGERDRGRNRDRDKDKDSDSFRRSLSKRLLWKRHREANQPQSPPKLTWQPSYVAMKRREVELSQELARSHSQSSHALVIVQKQKPQQQTDSHSKCIIM
jgi:ATP-dependent RNA helicase SUPV3L1/SUV3